MKYRYFEHFFAIFLIEQERCRNLVKIIMLIFIF